MYKRFFKGARASVDRIRLRLASSVLGEGDYWCNACDSFVQGFFIYGQRPSGCPYCKSLARERFILFAIHSGLVQIPKNAKRVLHIAPGEKALVKYFRRIPEYISGDIEPSKYKDAGAIYVDLTSLKQDEFNLIYASHVLEHIPDDQLALRNIKNSLAVDGQAWILVPLSEGLTEEGGPDLTPSEREARFGQRDHVRQYGRDIRERIESSGLVVTEVSVNDIGLDEVMRLGLDIRDRIYICRRALL